MNFKREKIKDIYLRDTQLENIFITEYMVDAEGDFIKVYLTAIMYADSEDMSNSLIARHLGLEEEDVLRAWNYWEKCGVIKKHYPDPKDRFHYIVEFVNLKARLYGAAASEEDQQPDNIPEKLRDVMDDKTIRNLFSEIEGMANRLLEGREPEAIVSWVYDDGLSPELIAYAYRFCIEKRRNNKFSYVSALINEWGKENIKTKGDAEKFLAETDLRHNQYRRIMKALGFYRNPTEAEEKKIDSWFDEMDFGLEKVLEACAKTSGISNPNINYVNSILKAWHSGSKSSDGSNSRAPNEGEPHKNAVARVKKLYEEQRRKNEELQEERRKAIYKSIPRIKAIDDELRKTSLRISRAVLTGGVESGVSADTLKQRITELNGEKAYLLTEQDLPHDYLELQYECKDCKDTGILENGERCKCFSEKLKLFV